MKVLNRREALTMGLPFYGPLRPCAAGHMAPRDTAEGRCTACLPEALLPPPSLVRHVFTPPSPRERRVSTPATGKTRRVSTPATGKTRRVSTPATGKTRRTNVKARPGDLRLAPKPKRPHCPPAPGHRICEPGMSICGRRGDPATYCYQMLPEDRFLVDGVHRRCRQCHYKFSSGPAAARRRATPAGRTKQAAYQKKWAARTYAESPEKQLQRNAARRAGPAVKTDWHPLTYGDYRALARALTRLTGFPWDVDHIVPLKGKLVSGLCWPGNYRLIPRAEHYGKGNKWNPRDDSEKYGATA